MTGFKIYNYVEPNKLPSSPDTVPYDLIFPDQLNRNLPNKKDILFGERRRSTYFDRFEEGEFLDPIIKVNYAFKRDDRGLCYEKIRTISWMQTDNKWSSEVQIDTIPVVTPGEKLREIKRRRANIIDELKGLAASVNLEDKILPIFESSQVLINSYIDAGSSKFYDLIKESYADWLDEVSEVTGNSPRKILLAYLALGIN